jgi:hypothetical protein
MTCLPFVMLPSPVHPRHPLTLRIVSVARSSKPVQKISTHSSDSPLSPIRLPYLSHARTHPLHLTIPFHPKQIPNSNPPPSSILNLSPSLASLSRPFSPLEQPTRTFLSLSNQHAYPVLQHSKAPRTRLGRSRSCRQAP